MKRYFIIIPFLSLLITFVGCQSTKSSMAKQETMSRVASVLDSTSFTFTPSSVSPSGGMRTRHLDGSYSLKIGKDTITSYLPYFGRAYSAPYSGEDAGIKFVSTDFDYKVAEKKKGITTVTIETKDTRRSSKLILTIGETGYTTLFVQENNRQSISFYGIIE